MDSTADQVVQNIVTLVSTWGLRMTGALAVLILGRFGCGVARKSVRRAMEGRSVDASLIRFEFRLFRPSCIGDHSRTRPVRDRDHVTRSGSRDGRIGDRPSRTRDPGEFFFWRDASVV